MELKIIRMLSNLGGQRELVGRMNQDEAFLRRQQNRLQGVMCVYLPQYWNSPE
jgi:hypothetical protein